MIARSALLPLLCVPALAAPSLAGGDYVAYWSFDEGQGTTVHDSSTNGFDGTAEGATWVSGVRGSALALDGFDDYVEITDGDGYPDLVGTLTEGTISIWFRFDTLPGINEIHSLFYLGDGLGGSGNSSLIIEVGHFSAQSKLYFTLISDDGQIPQCYDSEFNLRTDTWYHFAAVVGADFNTGYLNGLELVARDYNYGDAADHHFFDDVVDKRVCWIGRGFLGAVPADQYADAVIDEVRIYSRPLGADEVQGYYESIAGPIGDLDGDLAVGTSDLLHLLGRWGECPQPPNPCSADLDGDSRVATSDLLALLLNWD